MTVYDPQIIQRFADNLYRQARSIVITLTVLGVLGGGAAGLGLGDAVGGAVGAVLAGLVGFLIGRSIAFGLRLRAQTALCQLKIEENTRRIAERNLAESVQQ